MILVFIVLSLRCALAVSGAERDLRMALLALAPTVDVPHAETGVGWAVLVHFFFARFPSCLEYRQPPCAVAPACTIQYNSERSREAIEWVG